MEKVGKFIKQDLGNPTQYGERAYGEEDYGAEEPVVGEAQYGNRIYGDTKYGNARGFAGIWQTRHRRTHYLTLGEKETGELYSRKSRFYIPTNPRTEAQQAHRAIFSNGVDAWHLLSEPEQDEYNKKAEGRPLSGFNL